MSTATFAFPTPSAAAQRPLLTPVRPTARPHPAPLGRLRTLETRSNRLRALVSTRNVLIVVVIAFIFVGRLFISVATDANAYAIAEKSQLSQNLMRDAQFLREQLNVLNSPQNLSAAAQRLGMISNSKPAYLRISDGRRWGNPRVAGTGFNERTTIANVLLLSLLPANGGQGVAIDARLPRGADSGGQLGVDPRSGVSTIPAPNTH